MLRPALPDALRGALLVLLFSACQCGGNPGLTTIFTDLKWTPDGSAVLGEATDGIYLARPPDGMHKVTDHNCGQKAQYSLDCTRISADGRRMAYASVLKTTNIQRLRLDAGATRAEGEPSWLTTGSRQWANPDPTPDGEWVVFYSQDQPEGHIYVVRADGTGRRSLTSDQFVDRVPRWSPDKKWVAFFSTRSGGPAGLNVWRIRFDGSDLQPVMEGSVPVWSPDSSRLASLAAVTDLASRTTEVLPTPDDERLRPFIAQSWSPDGSRLAGQLGFSDRGGKGIVLYSFATRAYERLTDFGEWPAWFADSRRILFVSKGKEFWVLDTRTKQAKKIYSTVWDVLGPPRMTRDGRTVYYSRRVTDADIYLLSFE